MHIRQKFSTKPTGFTVDVEYRSNYLDLEIGTITRECARRKQKKKQRKAEGEEKGREARDKDALLLAPAGDVRRDFLFGPAQPLGGHHYCFSLACTLVFAFSFPFAISSRVPSLSNVRIQVSYASKECRGHCSCINYMLMKIPRKKSRSEITARIFSTPDVLRLPTCLFIVTISNSRTWLLFFEKLCNYAIFITLNKKYFFTIDFLYRFSLKIEVLHEFVYMYYDKNK